MKNQYFGDINDYRKYGLLRKLCETDVSANICWMLTACTARSDGRKTEYLNNDAKWRDYDSPLFDSLKEQVLVRRRRHVDCAENVNILPPSNFSFYRPILEDGNAKREAYFQEFISGSHCEDLLFFDPDNGLDVPSTPKGRKGSSRYLYRDELCEMWRRTESSILVYQHFPREKRGRFVNRIAENLLQRLGLSRVASLRTPHVVFFLLARGSKHQQLLTRATKVENAWGEQIKVLIHKR